MMLAGASENIYRKENAELSPASVQDAGFYLCSSSYPMLSIRLSEDESGKGNSVTFFLPHWQPSKLTLVDVVSGLAAVYSTSTRHRLVSTCQQCVN
jgi:hypothetical protein